MVLGPNDANEFDLIVGQPWPGEPVPNGLSLAWYGPQLLVLGADNKSQNDLLPFLKAQKPIRLGVLRFQNLAILLLELPGYKTLEGIYFPILNEQGWETSESDLWTLALVVSGTVLALRQFSTSLEFSRVLRAINREQELLGPITIDRGEEQIQAWEAKTSQSYAAWGFCTATSWAGA